MRRRSLIGLAAAAVAAPAVTGALGSQLAAAAPARPGTATKLAATDLGPNVFVFDAATSDADIQSRLDSVFASQESNQFGTERYALLFAPGTYHVAANIGFYTSIAGLGANPDDVTIAGDLTVDAGWFDGNATQNFWRSAENLSVTPSAGFTRWAVAQAAPFRRMHIRGDLNLSPNGYGWASGGYIADSAVDGVLQPYSQQQWYTRDSSIGSCLNGVWNMVFSGVTGAPANSFPDPPYTTLGSTPVSREKPYLYLDGDDYAVFVPSLRTNSAGTTWGSGATPGNSMAISDFHVATPDDSVDDINAALAAGKHLLLTPGIYHVAAPIAVTQPNTVVLGLGYATVIPDGGSNAMEVSDVDGVRIAGVLFDAGTTNSDVLLRIGEAGSGGGHAGNPTSVQDVFFRIGGAGPGAATTSLEVNSGDVLIDHIWAWRADHGTGVGWTANPAATGLVVNGANVTALGLFVEHYQNYEVVWNGDNGRTIFFQNEMPYDPPDQATWRGDGNGYAAYKVADGVDTHQAWGVGSYCNFDVNPAVVADRGFEVPEKPGIVFHDLLTVSLGGVGVINHVINDQGGPAQGTDTVPVDLVGFTGGA